MSRYRIDWGDGTSIGVGSSRAYAEQLLREASGPFLAKNPVPRVVEVPELITDQDQALDRRSTTVTTQTPTAPTPEQFLAQVGDDLEDDPGALVLESLASIAQSLQTLVDVVQGSQANVAAEEQTSDTLREQLDDLEAKHEALYGLLADVEKIVARSTSKLANSVRDAITAWRKGERPAEAGGDEPEAPAEGGEPGRIVGPAPQCAACRRYFADQALLDAHACSTEAVWEHPAHDAPLEEWLDYARSCGLEVDPGRTNRSQIRTLLGIPHGEEPSA